MGKSSYLDRRHRLGPMGGGIAPESFESSVTRWKNYPVGAGGGAFSPLKGAAGVPQRAAVTTANDKFIARPGGQSELYDRKKNPLETANLIDSSRHHRIRDAMATRLMNRHIATTGVAAPDRDGRDAPGYRL